MSKNKKLGFRDVVQTLYYRELIQNEHNLSIINSMTGDQQQFNSWDEFLELTSDSIAAILNELESELDCEHCGQDDIGYRQGDYPIDVIEWDGDSERSMYLASKIN